MPYYMLVLCMPLFTSGTYISQFMASQNLKNRDINEMKGVYILNTVAYLINFTLHDQIRCKDIHIIIPFDLGVTKVFDL